MRINMDYLFGEDWFKHLSLSLFTWSSAPVHSYIADCDKVWFHSGYMRYEFLLVGCCIGNIAVLFNNDQSRNARTFRKYLER